MQLEQVHGTLEVNANSSVLPLKRSSWTITLHLAIPSCGTARNVQGSLEVRTNAETQGAAQGQDEMEYVRLMWYEL